jgi:hypothetical protein
LENDKNARYRVVQYEFLDYEIIRVDKVKYEFLTRKMKMRLNEIFGK